MTTAVLTEQKANSREKSPGTMFYNEGVLKAYNVTRRLAGRKGKVASMPNIIEAKAYADSQDPLWTHYITTTSGEFYGKSKPGTEIVVVAHGIDAILQDNKIMQRTKKERGEKRRIQLTNEEFHKLENGFYCPVHVIEKNTIVHMRKYPGSVLTFNQIFAGEDPLLLARIGTDVDHLSKGSPALKFLMKHLEITLDESKNEYILMKEHKYPYQHLIKENAGELLVIGQLCDYQRMSEPSSVSSDLHLSDLSCSARFIAMNGKGSLEKTSVGLEKIFGDLENHWELLTVPNQYSPKENELYALIKEGKAVFTQFMWEDHTLPSGEPQFHVKSLTKVGETKTFVTEVLGYYGFFRYRRSDVRKMQPEGANAYDFGKIKLDNGAEIQRAPITFYKADVDTSRRILTEKEVLKNMGLVRSLLAKVG